MSLENVQEKFRLFIEKFGKRLDVDKNGKIGFDDFTAVYNQDIKKVAIVSCLIGFGSGFAVAALLV